MFRRNRHKCLWLGMSPYLCKQNWFNFQFPQACTPSLAIHAPSCEAHGFCRDYREELLAVAGLRAPHCVSSDASSPARTCDDKNLNPRLQCAPIVEASQLNLVFQATDGVVYILSLESWGNSPPAVHPACQLILCVFGILVTVSVKCALWCYW